MTDDLVKQLRGGYVVDYDEDNQIALCKEAADRIEELERQVAESDKRIESLEDEIQDLKYEMRELGDK